MERIVLELDDSLAKTWRNASEELRAEYYDKIVAILKEMQKEQFFLMLDKLGAIAAKNGMTEEILQQLLNEKD